MLHTADRIFMRRLVAKIVDQQNERVAHLVAGHAPDYADYRHRCGYMQALEDVRAWCEELAKTDDGPRPETTA